MRKVIKLFLQSFGSSEMVIWYFVYGIWVLIDGRKRLRNTMGPFSRVSLKCCNFKAFMEVANSIEEETLMSMNRRVQRVLVGSYVTEGLMEEIEVRWDEGSFIPHLDY